MEKTMKNTISKNGDYLPYTCNACGQKALIAMNAWEQNYHLTTNGCDSCSGKLSLPKKIIRKIEDGWYFYQDGKDIENNVIIGSNFLPNDYKKTMTPQQFLEFTI